jgi:SAM-dependent methyltransferase
MAANTTINTSVFSATSDYYDLIYANSKDYAAEATQIAALLRRLNPRCHTVLDVACGTGEHARHLAAHGLAVDELDLDPAFIRIAEQKNPAARFFVADMADFHLPYRYDAVLCLFSSIGYMKTLDRVAAALSCFRDHLLPGGVMVIEPWFAPGMLDTRRMFRNTGEGDGVRITRFARTEVVGAISRLHFDYEITDVNGTRHASEIHELGLFTTAELIETFRKVGLDVSHDPKGLADRGLFVARLQVSADSQAD